jgi:hypothetical protein
MSTLRDAIVDVIVKVWTEGEEEDDLSPFMAADILATPEMQAIKKALGWCSEAGLPENVAEWVLS